MQTEKDKIEVGVNFSNLKRKVTALTKELDATLVYLDKLEANITIYKKQANRRGSKNERSLNNFLSQEVSIHVLDDQLQMDYWEKETDTDREELARLKKERYYAHH